MRTKLLNLILLLLFPCILIIAQPKKGDIVIHVEKKTKETITISDTLLKNATVNDAGKILNFLCMPYKNMKAITFTCDSMPPFVPPKDNAFTSHMRKGHMHHTKPPKFCENDSIKKGDFPHERMMPPMNENDTSFHKKPFPPKEMPFPPMPKDGNYTIITIIIPEDN